MQGHQLQHFQQQRKMESNSTGFNLGSYMVKYSTPVSKNAVEEVSARSQVEKAYVLKRKKEREKKKPCLLAFPFLCGEHHLRKSV